MARSLCGLCGHEGQIITLSRRVRRGIDLLNPMWDPVPQAYELCPACGARRVLEERLAA